MERVGIIESESTLQLVDSTRLELVSLVLTGCNYLRALPDLEFAENVGSQRHLPIVSGSLL